MSGQQALQRRADWEARLGALVAKNRARAHEFGHWDCLLWPAAAVKAVTGHDFGRGHRAKYKSQAQAYRHLKRMGVESPEKLLDGLFDCKPVGFAQRGDLVLVAMPALSKAEHGIDIEAREIPAVVTGDEALLVGDFIVGGTASVGFLRVPRERWLKAWAVGGHHAGKLSKSRRKRALRHRKD